MLALHRAGRRADALDLYLQTWRYLRDELAIEPSAAVKAALREFDFPIGLPRDPVQDVDPEALSTISTLAKALRATAVPEVATR